MTHYGDPGRGQNSGPDMEARYPDHNNMTSRVAGTRVPITQQQTPYSHTTSISGLGQNRGLAQLESLDSDNQVTAGYIQPPPVTNTTAQATQIPTSAIMPPPRTRRAANRERNLDKDASTIPLDTEIGQIGGDEFSEEVDDKEPKYNYGTWTPAEDSTLLKARASGRQWSDLQRTHFPDKTANACRKRHERLVERRGIRNFDSRRLGRVAKEYMALREQMWTPLAERVGERWQDVEAKCMSAGVRALQLQARSYTNRRRRESRACLPHPMAEELTVGTQHLQPLQPPLSTDPFAYQDLSSTSGASQSQPAYGMAATSYPSGTSVSAWSGQDAAAVAGRTASSSGSTTPRNYIHTQSSADQHGYYQT